MWILDILFLECGFIINTLMLMQRISENINNSSREKDEKCKKLVAFLIEIS